MAAARPASPGRSTSSDLFGVAQHLDRAELDVQVLAAVELEPEPAFEAALPIVRQLRDFPAVQVHRDPRPACRDGEIIPLAGLEPLGDLLRLRPRDPPAAV